MRTMPRASATASFRFSGRADGARAAPRPQATDLGTTPLHFLALIFAIAARPNGPWVWRRLRPDLAHGSRRLGYDLCTRFRAARCRSEQLRGRPSGRSAWRSPAAASLVRQNHTSLTASGQTIPAGPAQTTAAAPAQTAATRAARGKGPGGRSHAVPETPQNGVLLFSIKRLNHGVICAAVLPIRAKIRRARPALGARRAWVGTSAGSPTRQSQAQAH